MEKKIWIMPQVGVQEFEANKYIAACTFTTVGGCIANTASRWWQWLDSLWFGRVPDGKVNFAGWNSVTDEIYGWESNKWGTSTKDNYFSEDEACGETENIVSNDRYWDTVAGLSEEDYQKSIQTGFTDYDSLNWIKGYATTDTSGETHIYGQVSVQGKS